MTDYQIADPQAAAAKSADPRDPGDKPGIRALFVVIAGFDFKLRIGPDRPRHWRLRTRQVAVRSSIYFTRVLQMRMSGSAAGGYTLVQTKNRKARIRCPLP